MNSIIFRPKPPSRSLWFDLADLLESLGDRALKSNWQISDLNYLSKRDREILPLHVAEGAFISGQELKESTTDLLQVVDGEFRGYEGAEHWITLKAVDSSWWEVLSSKSDVLAQVKAHIEKKQDNESQRPT
jgi:hypothetical protein